MLANYDVTMHAYRYIDRALKNPLASLSCLNLTDTLNLKICATEQPAAASSSSQQQQPAAAPKKPLSTQPAEDWWVNY